MSPEQRPEFTNSLPIRERLVEQLGARALRPVLMCEPGEIAQKLPPSDNDPARNEMLQSIAALGGEKMPIVDIVLAVDQEVDVYLTGKEYLARSVVYTNDRIPPFLRALIPEENTRVRKELTDVWTAYVENEHGLLKGKKPNSRELFRKGTPKPTPTGRTDRHRPKKRKNNSESYRASLNAFNLDNE